MTTEIINTCDCCGNHQGVSATTGYCKDCSPSAFCCESCGSCDLCCDCIDDYEDDDE